MRIETVDEEGGFVGETTEKKTEKKGLLLNWNVGSVSVSVQNEDVYSHPDLEFWT